MKNKSNMPAKWLIAVAGIIYIICFFTYMDKAKELYSFVFVAIVTLVCIISNIISIYNKRKKNKFKEMRIKSNQKNKLDID